MDAEKKTTNNKKNYVLIIKTLIGDTIGLIGPMAVKDQANRPNRPSGR